MLKYNKELHELGYGITRGDDRYKKGIKIMNKIKPIINKLKSDEAQEFFDRISSEEMEILKEEYELNDIDGGEDTPGKINGYYYPQTAGVLIMFSISCEG